MFDLKILAKYPFLNDAKTYVNNNKLSVKEVLYDPLYERARAIGIERLDNAFKIIITYAYCNHTCNGVG